MSVTGFRIRDLMTHGLAIDDGGDATLLIHEGVKAERHFLKSGEMPDADKYDNLEFKQVIRIIKLGLQAG